MSDDRQADVGSWDTDFPTDGDREGNSGDGDGSRKRIPFMKLKAGEFTVRLVGNHVKFHRHWQPFTERVISHIGYKSDDPAWQAGFYPRETFAIHVIDRSDGQLKILEKGRSLFKQFARYKIVNDTNPAGKDGPDWVIEVTGSGLQTKYSATAKAKPSTFTEEEIEMIKENKAPLKTIYATTPLEKIQELWNALPDEAKIPPKREENDSKEGSSSEAPRQTGGIKESMPDSPAESSAGGDDDLFGDDGDGDSSF
jgi:hypothetical protein